MERVEAELLASLFRAGPPVQDVYQPGALLRWPGSRQVYALLNGSLHAVESVAVFAAHGWGFEQVRLVALKADLDVVPMGPPLVA